MFIPFKSIYVKILFFVEHYTILKVKKKKIHKCLYEYRREIRFGDLNNALLQNIFKSDNIFDFVSATMLAYTLKRFERIFKAGTISLCRSIIKHLFPAHCLFSLFLSLIKNQCIYFAAFIWSFTHLSLKLPFLYF